MTTKKKRSVTITVTHLRAGTTSVPLPDELDLSGPDAKRNIVNYLQEHKSEIQVPLGDYVPDSDEIDTNGLLLVTSNDPSETGSYQ